MKKKEYLTPLSRLVPVGVEAAFMVVSGNQNISIENAPEEEWTF